MTQESYPKASAPFDLPQWRKYHADDTGVVGAPGSTARQILIDGSGPYVKRLPGTCMIQGVRGADDETWQATVPANTSGLWRHDRVVDQLAPDGSIITVLLPGTPAVTPALPDLTQEEGGTWQDDRGWFKVKPGFTGIMPGDAQLVDLRRFLPSKNTPVLREDLRPASPHVNDEVTFPDGVRQRWDGSAWETTGNQASPWTDYATSLRSYGGNASIGNGMVTARYKKIGRTVQFEWRLLAGSTTTWGSGVGGITSLLPAAPTYNDLDFTATRVQLGGALDLLTVVKAPGGDWWDIYSGNSGVQGSPVTGTRFRIAGTYESAS